MKPFDEEFWTLAMATAWVGHRDAEAVAQAAGLPFPIWKLTGLEPLLMLEKGFSEPLIDLAGSGSTEMKVEAARLKAANQAWEILLNALQGGRLDATGIEPGQHVRIPIPPHDWLDLHPDLDADLENERLRTRDAPYMTRFQNVRLRRKEIIEVFPRVNLTEYHKLIARVALRLFPGGWKGVTVKKRNSAISDEIFKLVARKPDAKTIAAALKSVE